ncbi:hypothetical protein B0T14DRAFT_567470 [Immersiella caudata]|uniref:NmrA-like domain-containing protein n=1 Tax=Immersiella caudata TaxID=314043 RepID=A0AA39WSF9_9PEZI|nr:hypothetical protein B0T14DRAFT_567470 [Immersiella caudata]
MVNIVIAGGNSQVAKTILSHLHLNPSHKILLLSRSPSPSTPLHPSTIWFQTDYSPSSLLTALTAHKTHTVLSFADARHDPDGASQIALINACLASGVSRFAPAEWSVSNAPAALADGKQPIRDYLSQINTPEQKLEYCLFQPGIFMNYLASPYPAGEYIRQLNTWFDFEKRRMIVVEGEEETLELTLTTVEDLARVVAKAVEYEGEWPVVGGMVGSTVTAGELVRIGERIRGGEWEVTRLRREDLERGEVKSGWVPVMEHPSIPVEMAEVFSREFVRWALVEGMKGGFTSGDEWNQILGDGFRFTGVEEFLRGVWEGKP